jgi:hypothetical protein
MLIIASYNGKQGPKNKAFNMFYSLYYPLHQLVLGMIAQGVS